MLSELRREWDAQQQNVNARSGHQRESDNTRDVDGDEEDINDDLGHKKTYRKRRK